MQIERTSEIRSLSDIRPAPRIDILLPSKESFGPKNAGAISGVVLDLIEESRTPDCFRGRIGSRDALPGRHVQRTAAKARLASWQ